MRKSEIVATLAAEFGLDEREVKIIITRFLDVCASQLAAGEVVKLHGFGRLETRESTAREWKSPLTGESVELKPKKRVVFVPGAPLREKVNGS